MIIMSYCLIFLTILLGFDSINCLPLAPPVYRKAELVLKRYLTNSLHDPVTHSLLNVLIHDKNARAFTTDQAIEQALNSVKKLDEQNNNFNSDKFLRQAIYGIKCKPNETNCVSNTAANNIRPTPSTDLKQKIVVALDNFFSRLNTGEDEDNDPSSERDN